MESGNNKLIGISELFRQSLSLFKKNYKVLISIGLVPVVYGIIQGLVSVIFDFAMPNNGFVMIFVGLIIFLFGILGVIIQTLYQVAIIKSIGDSSSESSTFNLKEIYKKSLSVFLSYWWVGILTGLVTIICYALFIIPGIIVSIFIGFAYFALILDGKKGLQALSASYYYVKGYWWSIFVRLLSVALITTILIAIVYAVLFVIFALFMQTFDFAFLVSQLTSQTSDNSILGIITSFIGSFVIYCVYTPFIFSFTFLIYKSLKTLKPEPSVDGSDFKTSRTWFKVLAIAGLVVFVLVTLLFLTIAIVFGYREATNKANYSLIETASSLR
jgi:hypothetical protein